MSPLEIRAQLLINASTSDLFYLSDADLVRTLQQLLVTYSQFKAAGIKP